MRIKAYFYPKLIIKRLLNHQILLCVSDKHKTWLFKYLVLNLNFYTKREKKIVFILTKQSFQSSFLSIFVFLSRAFTCFVRDYLQNYQEFFFIVVSCEYRYTAKTLFTLFKY